MLFGVLLVVAFVVLTVAASPGSQPPQLPVASWRRRLSWTAALAVVVALPALPTTWLSLGIGPRPNAARAVALTAVLFGPLLLLVLAMQAVRLPRAFRALLVDAPPPDIAAEVGAVASRLGTAVPPVLQMRMPAVTTLAAAFAWGLITPTVVVGDGIQVRLSPAQRAAIYAHELAHVRGHHVFVRFVAWSLCLLAVVLWADSTSAVWLAIASFLFATTVVAQPQELAADRAAARCVGADVMAAGLDVVHAANRQGQSFRGDALFYAVATHPSRVVREASLFAGDAVRQRAARRFRWTRGVVLAVWVALFAVALAAPVGAGWAHWPAIACVLPGLLSLAILGPSSATRRDVRQLRLSSPLQRWFPRLMLIAIALELSPLLGAPAALLVFGLLLLLVLLVWFFREQAVVRRLARPLVDRDLAGYLSTFAGLPQRLQRRPDLAIQAATVHAARGDQPTADAMLAVLGDHPGARYSRGVLALRRAPASAHALLSSLAGELPQNGLVSAALAEADLRVGDLASARVRVDRLLRERPREAGPLLLAARLARLTGDVAQASALLVRGEKLAPGEPATVFERALHDAATGAAGADRSLAKLREVHAAVPLARLEEALAEVAAASLDGGGR